MYRDADGNTQEVVATHQNLTVAWSDGDGDWSYTLDTLTEYANGERSITKRSRGNKEWAERIAHHYSLTVPEAKD